MVRTLQTEKVPPMPEVKASGVRVAVQMLREHLPAEYEAVIARLDERTRNLLCGDLLATGWLPMDAFARFLEAQVAVNGGDARTVMLERSELVMKHEFTLIHKAFAMLSSPESLMKRLSVVNDTYYRGIQAERVLLEKGRAVLRYTGFQAEHRIVEFTMIGFFRAALRASGAKSADAEFTTHMGDPEGYCELVVTWG
jgi:hypothetical protein